MPSAQELFGQDMPNIAEFFKGRSILITGATGFMGKVLIEKLLYSCPDIKHIYCLMRPKRGKEVQERMDLLKENAVFTRLREANPQVLTGDKLIAIAGDVAEKNLGLSSEDRQVLAENVSVFFHAAATVRFDDSFRKAVSLNTRGTHEALKLAEEMKQLVVFVYVSTTYAHTERKEIDEAVYPTKQNWRSMIRILDEFDDETLEIITPKILGPLPNTYSFSKGLAEAIVNDHRNSVPAIIFRPSIVCSAISEPMPGWHDNYNGPTGLLIGCGKGIIHSVYCNENLLSDYTPVDVGIKGMILAAWKNGVERSKLLEKAMNEKVPTKVLQSDKDDGRFSEYCPVYNCATSCIRNITIGQVANTARELAATVPLNYCLWYPAGRATTNRVAHLLVVYFMQIFPAIIVDCILRIRGQKPRLMRIQRRVYHACRALEFYLNNFWIFPNNKFKQLEDFTLDCDKEAFQQSVWDVDEKVYFANAMIGARKYLLNESEDTLPKAKAHIWRMYWLDKATRVLLVILLGYFLVRFFEIGSSNPQVQAVQSE